MSDTYLASLQAGLLKAMQINRDVVIIGEDLLDPYGGAFKVTKGLSSAFPTRVLASPISESAIVGVATGMAIRGFRPVAEIMFGDFMTLTVDQLVNSASKFALMYKNNVTVPIVVRTPMGGGRGYGPTHSQCLEKLFLGIPGLSVICPSIFHQPGLLLQASIDICSPILFVEYKNLYGLNLIHEDSFTVNLIGNDFPVAIVENSTESPDVILFVYGGLSEEVSELMRELKDEEIYIRAIVPSDLSSPLAPSVIAQYIEDCSNFLVADNNTPGFGWVTEIANWIHENALGKSINIRQLTAKNTVVPSAKNLEDDVLVTKAKLQDELFKLIA